MRLAAIRAESLKYTYSTALQRRHGHSLVSILPFMPHVDAFFIFKHLFLHSGVFFFFSAYLSSNVYVCVPYIIGYWLFHPCWLPPPHLPRSTTPTLVILLRTHASQPLHLMRWSCESGA